MKLYGSLQNRMMEGMTKQHKPQTSLSKNGYLIPIKQDSNNTYYFTIGSVSYSNYKTLKGAKIAIGKINPIY